ncbi:MAG TPA: hypothetical protein VEZ51_04640, partial [Gemmatimonadaceae bacterium]|nr:hypothetical protein [Gemmatimonadaceae bacterium]
NPPFGGFEDLGPRHAEFTARQPEPYRYCTALATERRQQSAGRDQQAAGSVVWLHRLAIRSS